MNLQFSIPFLFSVFTIQSFAQVDFSIRRQKLEPVFFDTTIENIFVYEVSNAILYFKQDDIKKFINNPYNKDVLANYGYKAFQDSLSKNSKQIKIKDILFSYDQTQRDSIFKFETKNTLAQKLNEEFYFIGAGLILDGRFMLYSKENNKLITKKLSARKSKGYLGEKHLSFYLTDGQQFYYIVTTLDE